MAEEFTCAVDEIYRSACKDLSKYSGSRYCVLHEPDEAKNKEDFLKAKASKLDRKDYDFGGTVFPEGTSNFEGFEFDANVEFAGVAFSGSADFTGARFSGELTNFRKAQFGGGWIYFSEAQFSSGRTGFRGARFSGEHTNFRKAQFSSEGTYFSEAQFSGEWTDFVRAQFSGGWIYFSEAQFSGKRADFFGATFNAQPYFDHTTFKNATFEHTTFQRGADFTGAKFDGTRAISNGTRERTTNFRRAIFGEELYFRGAEFKGFTDFYRTNFLDAVKFIGSESEEGPSLLFAREGQVSFKRARIDKPELFSFDTLFLRPSWFVGVDARKFDFTAVQWYGLFHSNGSEDTFDEAFDREIKGIREKGEPGSPYNLLAQACRRLSANAEENREYPLANEFHYWSMDAVRKESWNHFKGLTLKGLLKKETWRDIGEHFGLITTLYWALSGYGVRAARAFWVLMGMWATFTFLYVLVSPSEFKDFGQGIGYLWQAAVYSVLAMARLNPEPRPDEPGLFQFLVGFEGILGPLQIALLALAIRRKVMR